MIIWDKATPFKLDVGRPNIFSEDDRTFWKAFHALLDDWPRPIVANGFFRTMAQILDDESGYGGGGFSYTFWFESEQDVQDFVEAVKLL